MNQEIPKQPAVMERFSAVKRGLGIIKSGEKKMVDFENWQAAANLKIEHEATSKVVEIWEASLNFDRNVTFKTIAEMLYKAEGLSSGNQELSAIIRTIRNTVTEWDWR